MLTGVIDGAAKGKAGGREPEIHRLAVIARELRKTADRKHTLAHFILLLLLMLLWILGYMLVANLVSRTMPPLGTVIDLLVMAVIIWYIVSAFVRQVNYPRRLAAQLEQGSLLFDLATCGERLGGIFAHTPAPWRLLLGNSPTNLKGWLHLVGNNLDWYLAPPRARLRPEWFAVPLLPVTAYLFLHTSARAGASTDWNMPLLMLLILAFQLLVPVLETLNRHAALTALLDAILNRLEDDNLNE